MEYRKKRNKLQANKPIPSTISEYLFRGLYKIRKYYKRIELNDFSKSVTINSDEFKDMPDLNKAIEIYNFLKYSTKKNKIKFEQAKYNFINFDENIDKLRTRHGFDQANFCELIDKCKMLTETLQEKNKYIEKLEQEIILLNNQKNEIIDKTTKQINDLKDNLFSLIDKIKELKGNQKLIDEGKKEILLKTQKLQERTQENKNLRNEKKKLIQSFRQEKTHIILNKDSQIKSLSKKLEYAESYQQKLIKEEKEKAIFRNKYKEVKLHIETLMTKNEQLACTVAQLNADNYALNEKYKRIEKKLSNAISKLQL
jgi:chromosome segregation ATPase